MNLDRVRDYLLETSRTAARTADGCGEQILGATAAIVESLRGGGKLLLCGNGGSAGDAQHLATEFVSTLTVDRRRDAIAAIALTTDTSLLTAVANDYGIEHVFARQVEALGREGDVLIGISTSGKSANVVKAFEHAVEAEVVRHRRQERGIRGERDRRDGIAPPIDGERADELGRQMLGIARAAAVAAQQDLPAVPERLDDRGRRAEDLRRALVGGPSGRARGLEQVLPHPVEAHGPTLVKRSSRMTAAASRRSATTWSASSPAPRPSSSSPWPVRTRIVRAPTARPRRRSDP